MLREGGESAYETSFGEASPAPETVYCCETGARGCWLVESHPNSGGHITFLFFSVGKTSENLLMVSLCMSLGFFFK